mmetsp:Transcript_52633/g.129122  ORF Transcript_52633/g.129122 Transcript_52633/m.129122 type:complete len:208 (+) Transcript_52633:282-905(+)
MSACGAVARARTRNSSIHSTRMPILVTPASVAPNTYTMTTVNSTRSTGKKGAVLRSIVSSGLYGHGAASRYAHGAPHECAVTSTCVMSSASANSSESTANSTPNTNEKGRSTCAARAHTPPARRSSSASLCRDSTRSCRRSSASCASSRLLMRLPLTYLPMMARFLSRVDARLRLMALASSARFGAARSRPSGHATRPYAPYVHAHT